MDIKNYSVVSLPDTIVLGRRTETGVLDVRIDCTGWLVHWPKLTLSVWVTPPGGDGVYPATTHLEGNVLVWTVNSADTATAGFGNMEIVGVAPGQKKLSAIAKTQVLRTTTTTTTEPPEPMETWVDEILSAANEAESAVRDAEAAAAEAKAAAEEAKQNAGGGVADSVAWEDVTGKPSTYPPASHTHTEYLSVNGTAVNATQLNGKSADLYMLKTDTAADSAKLGGVEASEYAKLTDIPANVNSSTMDLLWENASPEYSFGAQTITLDLSDYVLILIILKNDTKANRLTSQIAKVGYEVQYSFNFAYSQTSLDHGYFTGRMITINTDSIVFGGGKRGGEVADDRMIPWFIYGIKGVGA